MKPSDFLRQQLARATPTPQIIRPEERSMIADVADAAYQGVDIARTYPQFWQQLQINQTLQHELLEFVEILEEDDFDQSSLSLSERASKELIHAQAPQPIRQQWSAERWRINWEQSVGQLKHLFSQPLPLTRRARSWSNSYELFTTHQELEGGVLDATLKIEQLVGSTTVTPTLIVVYTSQYEPMLEVTLQWGSYTKSRQSNKPQIKLPDILLTTIGDGTLAGVNEHLALTIQSLP